MAETLTLGIEDVSGPNENGYFTVTFTEGDHEYPDASTSNEEIRDAAFQARGTEAEVTIGVTQKGTYTNRYLNAVNGVRDKPKAAKAKSTGGTRSSGGDDARQKTIAGQWAVGRATELLIASGATFAQPLDSDDLAKIKETAESLLALRAALK